ncbi:hypothetical protein BgiMline_029937, partial [Biomphalaria glabrata]
GNLYQSPTTIVFHFRRRQDWIFSPEFHVLMVAGAGNYVSQTYVNKMFELHVLFQARKVYFYLNKQYVLTYDSGGNAVMETARYLGLYGELYAEEMAI